MYKLEQFTFKKWLSLALHYILYSLSIIIALYLLLGLRFDFLSLLKFIIYLKLKTYPGDFFDNTFLTVIYIHMFFMMIYQMNNT